MKCIRTACKRVCYITEVSMARNCPFLDTINRLVNIFVCIMIIANTNHSFCCRSVLDFDFEKLCSVSLSNINVYACLVCGKYFQGIYMYPFYDCVVTVRTVLVSFQLCSILSYTYKFLRDLQMGVFNDFVILFFTNSY